ncbi:hypothetical protein RM572_21710 [Streptomyces sp. DSM 42041]|uniref:Uncharacterized protein n=1 Tax=Streptomyces hazeniae TaxID=3075538 RepID=A0ABU2P0G2_9ACTN|nr:hypothetical protein [Streptomyces sp. DSM 42041]MDT0381378.1 hypothetical protein [Streptomyces sp. DSM 42041]
MNPVKHCVLRMQTIARAASDPTDHVAAVDARTSMDDARIALCVARGVPLEDIDPSQGYDLTRRAYESVRDTWIGEVRRKGLSEYTRPWFEAALAYWREHRPEFVEGDDWLAAAGCDPDCDGGWVRYRGRDGEFVELRCRTCNPRGGAQ